MKNKFYLYSMFAATLVLGGCDYNEEHFPGFDELAHPTHIWNDTIMCFVPFSYGAIW